MIIGPGEPRRPEPPPKARKKAKAEAKKRRREAEAAAPDATPEPAVVPSDGARAVADASRSTSPTTPDAEPDPTTTAAPTASAAPAAPAAPAAVPGDVPLTARIDALRGRVDDLLALVDATVAEPGPAAPDPADPGPSSHPAASDAPTGSGLRSADPGPAVVATSADLSEPAAPATGATSAGATPTVVTPPSSAVLVARELLAGGMAVDGVRARLREAYGVADPDAVLAGAPAQPREPSRRYAS